MWSLKSKPLSLQIREFLQNKFQSPPSQRIPLSELELGTLSFYVQSWPKVLIMT